MNDKTITIAGGHYIILRDTLASDLDFFLRIQTRGQWRDYDAPWEGIRTSITPEEESQYRANSWKILQLKSHGRPNPL